MSGQQRLGSIGSRNGAVLARPSSVAGSVALNEIIIIWSASKDAAAAAPKNPQSQAPLSFCSDRTFIFDRLPSSLFEWGVNKRPATSLMIRA